MVYEGWTKPDLTRMPPLSCPIARIVDHCMEGTRETGTTVVKDPVVRPIASALVYLSCTWFGLDLPRVRTTPLSSDQYPLFALIPAPTAETPMSEHCVGCQTLLYRQQISRLADVSPRRIPPTTEPSTFMPSTDFRSSLVLVQRSIRVGVSLLVRYSVSGHQRYSSQSIEGTRSSLPL